MPATLSFFDMSVSEQVPPPYQPIPITTGPNWQPGDYRFCFQNTYIAGASSYPLLLPPGYSWAFTNAAEGIAYRQLVAGDTDTFVQYATPSQFAAWCVALWTVRGVSPGSVPTGSWLANTVLPASSTGGTSTVPSFSVPVGAGVIICQTIQGTGTTFGAPNVGPPTGWTNLVATAGSGAQYTPFGNTPSSMLCAKAFSSAGSTGTFGVQYGACLGSSSLLWPFSTSIAAAADVSATASSPPTTSATAGNATFSVSSAVTISTGSPSATATASTAFNPLFGVWLSDPLTLPGNPVTGSVVRWSATQPAGTTVLVETSINGGASWDTATVNLPVPRLATGDTTTRSVLARVTLSRTTTTAPPPRVTTLEVQVSVDAGVDELVPVGHGMIDKVTASSVGGSTGTGSVTNVVSSSAVISRGGGQTGGGTSIKIHVTDLSGEIKRNVWAMPYTVPSGTNYATAVQAMVKDRLPSQTSFALSSTSHVTPLLVFGMQQGGDPWQDILDLATAIGFEAFFDPSGVFTFRPVPDPSVGDPVWVFDENFNPLVAEASRELSNDQTFNHVIVSGQATSSANPVTAEAFDNNPSSPTYILGPFGEKTERLTFSTVTTTAQAQAMANALLFNSLGGADTVTIACVPMPALEPGDIVKVNISDVNVDGNYMINSMTTSLSPADPQQLVCFRQSTS